MKRKTAITLSILAGMLFGLCACTPDQAARLQTIENDVKTGIGIAVEGETAINTVIQTSGIGGAKFDAKMSKATVTGTKVAGVLQTVHISIPVTAIAPASTPATTAAPVPNQ